MKRDDLMDAYNAHCLNHWYSDFVVCELEPCKRANEIERLFGFDWVWNDWTDPFEAFSEWCAKNGFLDLAGFTLEAVNLDRLCLAVEEYKTAVSANMVDV